MKRLWWFLFGKIEHCDWCDNDVRELNHHKLFFCPGYAKILAKQFREEMMR